MSDPTNNGPAEQPVPSTGAPVGGGQTSGAGESGLPAPPVPPSSPIAPVIPASPPPPVAASPLPAVAASPAPAPGAKGGASASRGGEIWAKIVALGGAWCSRCLTCTKSAVADSWVAFKELVADPVGGQEKALGRLGGPRALMVGATFVTLHVLVSALVGGGGVRGFSVHGFSPFQLGWIPSLLIPICFALGLWGVTLLIGKIWGSGASVERSLFVSGVALLPLVFAGLLGYIALKFGVVSVAVGLNLFGYAMAVVLLQVAFERVEKVPSRLLILLTPAVLVIAMAVAWLGGSLVR